MDIEDKLLKHTGPAEFIQGFRKVDPDRWEFANEGFLAGRKHLLVTIKRRRNSRPQLQNASSSSLSSSSGVLEIGGMDEELERLKRDRSILLAETVKLKQQQQKSKQRLADMEERLRITERKQHQMMRFLAGAFKNPAGFHQHLAAMNRHVEIGQKRRLMMSPEVKEEEAAAAAAAATVTAAGEHDFLPEAVFGPENEVIWDELFNENPAVEELGIGSPELWDDDLQNLVHQLDFL